MRLIVTIIWFFIAVSSFAQADSVLLKEAMVKLDKALIEKDTATLKTLLHADVSYGHSNGWVETKKEVLSDLISGLLAYKTLANDKVSLVVNEKWASARMTTKATGVREGKDFELTLHILQVWIKTKSGWKLVARQSAKLS
jgi:Domain of unknown function (DUF4440)